MTRCVFWSTSLSMASTFSNSAHTGRQQSSMSRHPWKVDTLATSETRTHQTEPTVVRWPMVLDNSLQPQQKEMPQKKWLSFHFIFSVKTHLDRPVQCHAWSYGPWLMHFVLHQYSTKSSWYSWSQHRMSRFSGANCNLPPSVSRIFWADRTSRRWCPGKMKNEDWIVVMSRVSIKSVRYTMMSIHPTWNTW